MATCDRCDITLEIDRVVIIQTKTTKILAKNKTGDMLDGNEFFLCRKCLAEIVMKTLTEDDN